MILDNQNESSYLRNDVFANKTALITGAGRGIGLAIAQLFCQSGISRLLLLGRNQERLEQTAKDLSIYRETEILTFALDLADPDFVQSALGSIKQKAGVVDILVNNAGVYQTASVANHALSTWQRSWISTLQPVCFCPALFCLR